MLKRPFGLAVSFIAIIATSPLLILIAIWIKLDSPGPVFYRGARVELHSKPFRIYKFSSMVINADRIGGPSTAGEDPRITMAGKFVRKYKLDELPEFISEALIPVSNETSTAQLKAIYAARCLP